MTEFIDLTEENKTGKINEMKIRENVKISGGMLRREGGRTPRALHGGRRKGKRGEPRNILSWRAIDQRRRAAGTGVIHLCRHGGCW